MIFERLIDIPGLWDTLKYEAKPIFLYGTGNGADKILNIMNSRSIKCAGVFASDGFVRDRYFREMKVRSYFDVRAEFGDEFVILCAFGSPRKEVIDFVRELDTRHDLYIPEVPLFCDNLYDELFTHEYLSIHRNEIEKAYSLFSDDYSRELYFEMLAFRLTGKIRYLSRVEDVAASLSSIVPSSITKVIDCGAFRGDTAKIFISVFKDIEKILCIEPDPRTFRHLCEYAEEEDKCIPLNAMTGERSGKCTFMSSASRASSGAKQNKRSKETECDVCAVDDTEIARSSSVGELLIKYDVEGAEKASLIGSRETVSGTGCCLSVSLYHRTEDIFALPILISSMHSGYKFYLRRSECIPAWELNLYAV